MTTLHVDRRGAALSYRDGAIEIRVPDLPPSTVPVASIDRIILTAGATLTTGLLAQCWTQGTGVLVLSGRRLEPTARLFGAPHKDAEIRVAQVLASTDSATATGLATLVVRAKLQNGLAVMRRLRCRSARETRAAAVHLGETLRRLSSEPPPSLDVLRGLEGAAAAAYLRALVTGFASSLGFTRRVRRPPTDPVNAALSLGYTLATFEAGRQGQLVGLDPGIGALHPPAWGRDSLALDLVEPVRPHVDLLVHRVFLERTLRADHFRTAPDGAVLLGKAGRAAFYAAWEEAFPPMQRMLRRIAREAVREVRAAGEVLRQARTEIRP